MSFWDWAKRPVRQLPAYLVLVGIVLIGVGGIITNLALEELLERVAELETLHRPQPAYEWPEGPPRYWPDCVGDEILVSDGEGARCAVPARGHYLPEADQ